MRGKAAIARWKCVCSSAWSRAGIRDEREWVGSYTDDGEAGDFDGPFWLGATGNGGFVVAEDDQNDMRMQFFDAVGSRDEGRTGRPGRLGNRPTILKTIELAEASTSLGVDRLGCVPAHTPALCAHEDALYVALTLEMVPYFTPYAKCEAARKAAYATCRRTRRVAICRRDLGSSTTHPPAGSLCELEMTYVAPLPKEPNDETHPAIAVHAGTVYVHVGDRIALLDAHTLARCGTLGEADLTAAATDTSRWMPSLRPESLQVGALAVYSPASELYVAVPRTADILVFAIGDHAHSGRCIRRLEGCREAGERPVHLAVGGNGGWVFVGAARSNRVLRLSRDGVVLQTLSLFECTLIGLAVGSGAVGSAELYVLCNAPGEWNVYGEGDSTVHVLQIRGGDRGSSSDRDGGGRSGGGGRSDGGGRSGGGGAAAADDDESADSRAIAPRPTAPPGSWQVKGGFGYTSGGEDEWAVVPPYLARILEAAHLRGDARLTSMYRGQPFEAVLQPEPPEVEAYGRLASFGAGSEDERYALRRREWRGSSTWFRNYVGGKAMQTLGTAVLKTATFTFPSADPPHYVSGVKVGPRDPVGYRGRRGHRRRRAATRTWTLGAATRTLRHTSCDVDSARGLHSPPRRAR